MHVCRRTELVEAPGEGRVTQGGSRTRP